MKPQVYHVDAFTSQPFRGNSPGVVFPPDILGEAKSNFSPRKLGLSKPVFCRHTAKPMWAAVTFRPRGKARLG
ncbi:PhzF family phenazine biosynthesis protein, partial [Escherichia coli]|nr:PhzF family phenazine biosynthesis protein [Escherichia coli]